MPLMMKYFVLKPEGKSEYNIASRHAMLEYARTIEPFDPVMAEELRNWVARARVNNVIK